MLKRIIAACWYAMTGDRDASADQADAASFPFRIELGSHSCCESGSGLVIESHNLEELSD